MKARTCFILTTISYVFTGSSVVTAGLSSPPVLEGMVTSVQYGEKVTTYQYDAEGKLIYVGMGGPNDMAFEYYDPNRLARAYKPLSVDEPNILELEYDVLGQPVRVISRLLEQEGIFAYDALGYLMGVCSVETEQLYPMGGCDEGNSVAVSLANAPARGLVPLGSWPERMIWEGTEATAEGCERAGVVNYYEYDDSGRVTRMVEGHTGEATIYEYDPCDPNRLAGIIEPTGPIRYGYDSNGRLISVDHYEDCYDGSFEYITAAGDVGGTVGVASNTLCDDVNHLWLGKLELHYDSDGMLSEVRHTSDESDLSVPGPVCTCNYEYDGLKKITRVACQAAGEPNLVVTIDPNISEAGSYMVAQYEYDTLGRQTWTVETSGNVRRILYNTMDASFPEGKVIILNKKEVNPDLHAPPKLMWYEYDPEGRLLRASDLSGHYQVYRRPLGGGGQYSAGLGGGGQYIINLGGGGQYAVMLGGGGQYFFLPWGGGGQYMVLGGGGIGKMLGPFGFDEYANIDAVIEEEEVAGGAGEILTKIKKKICKKAAKKKTAVLGCKEAVEGDLNGDCKVNWHDVALIAAAWLQDQSP